MSTTSSSSGLSHEIVSNLSESRRPLLLAVLTSQYAKCHYILRGIIFKFITSLRGVYLSEDDVFATIICKKRSIVGAQPSGFVRFGAWHDTSSTNRDPTSLVAGS